MSVFNEDFADDETTSVVTSGTYANGYRFRRTLRIGGSAVAGATALTDLPLRFDETLPGLRSTANGGNVQSTSGWDVRFEDTSGGKLKHELEIYDPVAGRAACWVRVPSVTPGIDRDILVYYGKSGLTGPEQDVSATGTWQRCLGCWRMPDGRDMTGHGRDLTSSGVTGGTIGGHPAAVLTASSYLELLDTTFMDSKSEFTPFLLFRPSSLPSGGADFVRFGGTVGGTGKLGFNLYDQPDIAKALRNYVALGASTAFVIGAANSAVVGHTYTWAVPCKSGAWPVQEFDGAPVTSTQRGAFGTGLTAYPSSILLRIGAGYGDFTACVPGAYGRFWVFDSRVPDAFVAFLDLTIRFPRACYGIGAEDSSTDTDSSPVMAPVLAIVGAGGTVDVDVLAHAADRDGTPMTVGTESPPAALGSTSIVANNVHYVAGSVQGTDRVGVTATAGAKAAHALMTVAVGPGDGGGGVGAGAGAEGATPDFPAMPTGVVKNCTASTLQATYNALTANEISQGVTICVNYGAVQSITGGLTLGKSGTAGKPIVVRVGGWNAATSTFTEPNGSNAAGGTGYFPDGNHRTATASWTGPCTVGGSHNWVRGLRFQGGAQLNGDGNRFNRCFFDSTASTGNDNGVGNVLDWCELTEALGGLFFNHPAHGCRNAWIYRCHFHDNGTSANIHEGCQMMTGLGSYDQFLPSGVEYMANIVVQDCLYTNQKFFAQSLELKCSGVKVLRCSFSKGTGDKVPRMAVRHGNNCEWRACHFGDANLELRGLNHIVADCTASKPASLGPAGGDITATNWCNYVKSHIGPPPQDGKPTTNYQTGENNVFAGTDFALLLGYNPAGGTLPPPGTIIESDCTGAVNKDSGCSPLASYTTRPRSVSRYIEAATGQAKKPRLWTGGVDVGPNGTYTKAQ